MKLPSSNFFVFGVLLCFCSFCQLIEVGLEQSYTSVKQNRTIYLLLLGFGGHGVYGSAGCQGSPGDGEETCPPSSISRAVCLRAPHSGNKYTAIFCRLSLGTCHFTASHRDLGGWHLPGPSNCMCHLIAQGLFTNASLFFQRPLKYEVLLLPSFRITDKIKRDNDG